MHVKYFFVVLALLNCISLNARTIYVDQRIGTQFCKGKYSIVNRDCNGNDGDAYRSIADAMTVVAIGDMILIRAGVYNESVIPKVSGSKERKIFIRGMPSENVVLSGLNLSPAIYLESRNDIIFENIQVRNVNRWVNVLGCKRIEFKNCIFRNAMDSNGSSKTGLFFQDSDYNKILNCTIDSSTQDNIGLIQSSHNLIQNNTITRAAHALWAIKCGSFNVFKNNYFANSLQKIGEIYDCDEVGFGSANFPKISKKNNTKCNLIEKNIFALTSTPVNASPYAGIQLAAQSSIIRRNVFYDCIGPPIDLTLYGGEAENNYDNKIYHNVMYKNHFGGIRIPAQEGSYLCFGNEIFNNIFFKNDFQQYDTRWQWYKELDEKPVQVMFSGSASPLKTYTSTVYNNGIFNSMKDELYTVVYGDRFSGTNSSPQNFSWWEAYYGSYIHNNIESDPEFVNAENYNFTIQPSSKMIDQGAYMTTLSVDAVNDTVITVEDAAYFYDGFGIDGLNGDSIKLENSTDYFTIKSVDYVQRKLTINKPLSVKKGSYISQLYYGEKPDIGIVEINVINKIDQNNSSGISVSYNRLGQWFYINSLNHRFSEISIFTIEGHEVYRFKEAEAISEIKIPAAELSSGVYLILVKGTHSEIAKIIKH
ncbi:MAG: hypothetical protein HOP11_13495 [Saprospiraceae bacterium]|nr:hypothetical protein [Saprospiraceae bacterium]